MKKSKILAISSIIILMVMGLIWVACSEPGENCRGTGNCTVTIIQSNGLHVDDSAEFSSCGDQPQMDYSLTNPDYVGGCKVAAYYNGPYVNNRRAGTTTCDC